MKWGAHEIAGRTQAKHALKIRAALRQSFDAKAVYAQFLDTHPYASKNMKQDRAKAKAWAILHVRFNNEPVMAVMKNLWAEGYVTGRLAAVEYIYNSTKAQKSAVTGYVDWQHWKAGSQAKAELYRPEGSLKAILDKANTTIKGLDAEGYNRLGNALADSFQLGLSPARSAKLIQDVVADPARSLSIAITEGSRAANMGAMDTYQQAGIDQWEWLGSDPCPAVCEENDGEIVTIGEPFPSEDIHPPAHPNCQCTVGAVLPDYTSDNVTSDSGNANDTGWNIGALAAILGGMQSNNTDQVDEAWNALDGFFDE